MNKTRLITALAALLILCTSCFSFSDSNCEIEITDAKTIVTTSKRAKGRFFIFFTPKGTAISTEPSDKVDYIELKTESSIPQLIFDTNNPTEIYLFGLPSVLSSNEVNYKFQTIDNNLYDDNNLFYDAVKEANGMEVTYRALKESCHKMSIDPMRYEIILDEDIVKKGDILGGW